MRLAVKMQEDRCRKFLSRFWTPFFPPFSLETEESQNNFSSRTFLLSKTSHSESGRISLQFRKHRGGILPPLAPFIGILSVFRSCDTWIFYKGISCGGAITARDAAKCSKLGISYGSSVCKGANG